MAVPSMSLAGKIHRARLADDDDLDLAGILQLALDLAGDLVGQLGRPAVVDGVGRHDDAHLAPRLNGEHLLDPRELTRELLQLGEALDVGLERLAPGPPPRARDRVCQVASSDSATLFSRKEVRYFIRPARSTTWGCGPWMGLS